MKAFVLFDLGIDNKTRIFEYTSKYNRINAKGINDEAMQHIEKFKKLGYKDVKILKITRIKDLEF